MKIFKNRDRITITHGNREVNFCGLPPLKAPRVKGEENRPAASRDELLFEETRVYWSFLSEEAKDEIFGAYEKLSDLEVEDNEIIRKHIGSIVKVLAKHHTLERFEELYPMDRVWIPEKLENTYDSTSPNYPQEMTYLRPDYHKLVILAMWLKPFIPVFAILGAYAAGNSQTQDMKREVVYNLVDAYELLAESGIAKCAAVVKLRGFLDQVLNKFQKEQSKRTYNNISLSVLSAMHGYGSDMMADYILAFTLIKLLAIRPVTMSEGLMSSRKNNIVANIFFNIKAEVDTGFAKKISKDPRVGIFIKPHPENVVFNGEVGKINAFDLIQSRSPVPVSEYVRVGVFVTDYRRALKTLDISVAPAQVKILIDSIVENHTGAFTTLHEWLIAAALHRRIDRRALKDIKPEAFMHAMGLAQAVFIHYGMYDLAQLLSCTLTYGNNTGFPIAGVPSDLKNATEIYYPHVYRTNRSTEQSTLRESLTLLLNEHVVPYYYDFKSSPDAAALLHYTRGNGNYVPQQSIQSSLVEFLRIQAKHKLEEVDFYKA